MSENLMLLMVFVMGSFLGVFFFGGLWWTVQRGLKAKRPALWFFGSLLIRTGVTLAGFYGVADGDWRKLLACLAGFIAARLIVVRLTRSGLPETSNPIGD